MEGNCFMHLKEAGSFHYVLVFVCAAACVRACVCFNFQNQSSVQWHRAHRVGQLEAALLHRSGRRDIPLHSQFPQDQQIAPSRWLQGTYLHHNILHAVYMSATSTRTLWTAYIKLLIFSVNVLVFIYVYLSSHELHIFKLDLIPQQSSGCVFKIRNDDSPSSRSAQ